MGDFLNEMLENAKHLEAMQELNPPELREGFTVTLLRGLLEFGREPGVNLSDVRQRISELIEQL